MIDRVAVRRQVLRLALRSGELTTVARAASRARLPALRLDPREAERSRVARLRLGRALRVARARQGAFPEIVALPSVAPAVRPSRRRRLALVAAAALAAALVFAFFPQEAAPEFSTVPPGSPADTPAANPGGGGGSPARFLSLGRVITPVATPTPEPTPSATPEPTPQRTAAAAAPGPTQGTSTQPGAGASGPPGSGAGGSGTYTPGELQPGFVRIMGRVVDFNTRVPIIDACVRLGLGCLALQPHTDANGIFSFDVPVGSRSWDLVFESPGYRPSLVRLSLQRGQNLVLLFDVRLRPI